MYLNAGYLHNCKLPYKDKSKPLIVCSCGMYRLINKEKLPTWRPKGRLDFQLVYIAAGKARFFFGEEVMDIPAGHMILFQPRQEQHYEYYAQDKPEVFWLHFTGSDVKNILRSYNIPLDERYFYTGVTSIYQQLFTGMIQELQNCRIGYEELLAMYLRQLLLMVQRYRQDPKSNICPLHQEEIDLARRYFHAHYNEEINIEQYAQSIHMSPCWFNRTFKATTGCTPTQYITDIRMKVAAQLLVTTHDSIKEIASLVGYDNPYYFSRIFCVLRAYPPAVIANQISTCILRRKSTAHHSRNLIRMHHACIFEQPDIAVQGANLTILHANATIRTQIIL